MQLLIAATDGSEGADRAVEVAAKLAGLANCSLLIVTVSEDNLSGRHAAELSRLGMTEGDALEEFSSQVLMKARVRAQQCGATIIETIESTGDPAATIIELSRRKQADAIVVGRRGRGRLEGLLLGSVSQKLACLAPCSLIIVP